MSTIDFLTSKKGSPGHAPDSAVDGVRRPAWKRSRLRQNARRPDGTSKSEPIEQVVTRDRVVDRLLALGVISRAHVDMAVRERIHGGEDTPLWRSLLAQPEIDKDAVYLEAARTYAFPENRIQIQQFDAEVARSFVRTVSKVLRDRMIEMGIVPVAYGEDISGHRQRLVLLTHDPSAPEIRELLDELEAVRYEVHYASEAVVRSFLDEAFPRKNEYLERISSETSAFDLGTTHKEERSRLIDEDELDAEINRSNLINLFEAALVESVRSGASDIHIIPNSRRHIEIHFRVDGRLRLWHEEEKVHPEALLAVVKDRAVNVDRFERDGAQDGFIQREIDGALIRYRVSVLPIATSNQDIHAESVVIRVLDDRKIVSDLSQLGLSPAARDLFEQAIRQPHGMVILTGPTGSGKSTTLVAALHEVVDPEINVLSIEDPVEYVIPGVRQIKLSHKLSLDQALRSVLRHDPDVVMVGEMRDRETAELAVKLANTGHLTFSTLHTNDAPSAVARLYKMGVEPFLIAYAINLVVAQRLIRKLCPSCKQIDETTDPVLTTRLGFTPDEASTTTFYRPGGDATCRTCGGSGYKGRRAITETLYFSQEIRHLIVNAGDSIDESAIRRQAANDGMLTLEDSAREVVKAGETSLAEMMRVVVTL